MKVRVYNDEPARPLTNGEIALALDKLDSSCPRDEWIKIGMALKDAGEDLFEEWNDWSARGEGYNEKDALTAWESFKPGKITLGSLLYRARQNGWIDPRRVERSAPGRTERQESRPSAPLDEDAKQKRDEDRNKFAAYMEKNGYKIAAIYRYSDSYFVYRLEHPKEKKVFSQISFDGKAWSATAPKVRPLFNLESLLEADPQEQVFVFEGEKCAIAAEGLGLLATTSSGGSGGSASTDWSPLRGRSVVIVPDRDEPGEKYALAVEKILRGLECEIRIVRLEFQLQTHLLEWENAKQGTPPGFDLVDWIERRVQSHENRFQSLEDDKGNLDRLPQILKNHEQKSMENRAKRHFEKLVSNARVLSRREGSSLLDDLVGFEEGLALTHGKKFLGLECGYFRKLDEMLDGWRGFGVLAAEPGVGKTTLLLQVGLGIVATNPDACFVFFSFEMPRAPMLRRLAAQSTQIGTRILRKGDPFIDRDRDGLKFSPKDRTRLADGMVKLRVLAPRICIVEMEDLGQVRGLSHEEIRDAMIQKVELFKARSKCGKAFVLVDHLAKVPIARDSAVSSLELDEARVSLLLETQRRLDDPLVVISQVRKSDFDKPGMASAKGSAEISYSPDFLITLSKKKEAEIEEEPLDFVKKYREGKPKRTFFSAEIVKGRDEMDRGIVRMIFNIEEQRVEEMQD
jgi:hypothetical protein